ncbi:hypothetical protein [Marinicella gelatinilytica]|uniref:hypothetical protein n=1 Tax=Marinicella gelatinilytica TaxID=2996017 RepID=UPI002260D256|nr:hypothetical protein [Marinicella gelatinilytica]MCX7544816.1 hypothetical protein [Marinicella gelatinilytica]
MKNYKFIVLTLGLMLLSSALSAKVIPSDGHWRTYDDPAIGSGINIRTQGDITMVIVFTYREDGSPVWYYATGEIDDNGVFDVPLMETKKGEFIFNRNPQTAEVFDPEKRIKLTFNATETGTLSINDSEPKPIHTYRFGIDGIETEQLTTPLGEFYQFPDLTGQWSIGNATDEMSLTIDFFDGEVSANDPDSQNASIYFDDGFYLNNSLGYYLSCPVENESPQAYCQFNARIKNSNLNDKADLLSRLYVFIDDIGMNTMTLRLQPEGDDSHSREHPVYQAFRLDADYEENAAIDYRTFPVEGHWRTTDDPEIGSGINFHSQGDIVMMTVFTYDDNGLPIWYMATGELGDEGGVQMDMFNTRGGSPIESMEPTTAKINDVEDVKLGILGNQVVGLTLNDDVYKEVFNYNFGYAEFQTSERQQNSSDPLKIATPEGWWLMAEENAANSLLLHLVKNTEKLTPPIPTDWVFFENKAASSDFIKGVECPTDYVYQWAYCGVLLAEDYDSERWSLSMNHMGATTWKVYFPVEMPQANGYSYYMMHRINSPMQP